MKRICILVLVVLLAACSRDTARVLDEAEVYMQPHPDSALALIRGIDTTKLRTRALKARYALLHAMALDKNWIDTTDVNVVMPAVAYYTHHESVDPRGRAYYYLGRIQENAGDYAEAVVSFMRAENCAAGGEDPRFRALTAAGIARMYGRSFDYAEALKWDSLAYSCCVSAADTVLLYSARQRLAIDYNNLGHYAEADSLYRILESDSSRVFSQLMPDIYSGHALLNVTMGHYEEACRLYEQSLSINPRFNHRNHWGAYAYALGQTGRQQRSEAIFRQLSAGGGSNDYSFLTWKSRHAATLADYEQAYELLRQSSKQQEENLRKALHQTVLKSQRDYFEEETLRQTRERTLFRMVCWLLGILFLMVVIWGYSAFRRRRRQSRERESMLLETANVLMAERESLQQERSALYSRYAQFVQLHFKELGSLMKTTADTTDRNLGIKKTILYEKIEKAWLEVLSDRQGSDSFERYLDESFNDIMRHLREDFPDREEVFYRFAGYVFAGFDTDLLMILMDTPSRDAIYSRKKRFRQEVLRSDAPHKEQFILLLT